MVQKLLIINFIIKNSMISNQIFMGNLGHTLDIVGKAHSMMINKRY
jgi:hypothetical protein